MAKRQNNQEEAWHNRLTTSASAYAESEWALSDLMEQYSIEEREELCYDCGYSSESVKEKLHRAFTGYSHWRL